MKISFGLSKSHWPLWLKRAKAKDVITGIFFVFLAILGHSKSFSKQIFLGLYGLQRPNRLAFYHTANQDHSYEQIKKIIPPPGHSSHLKFKIRRPPDQGYPEFFKCLSPASKPRKFPSRIYGGWVYLQERQQLSADQDHFGDVVQPLHDTV